MTTPEGPSRYKCIRKPLLHKVIFSLENLQQRFGNRTFFQIKDLRHPGDTSICLTADYVNFVTNSEYLYCTLRKEKKEKNKCNNKNAMNQQHVNCPSPLSLFLSRSYTHPHLGTHKRTLARTYQSLKGS